MSSPIGQGNSSGVASSYINTDLDLEDEFSKLYNAHNDNYCRYLQTGERKIPEDIVEEQQLIDFVKKYPQFQGRFSKDTVMSTPVN